jgi:malate dehydrogenase (oxaloacetate-decarboxylating)(NADP+)
LSIDYLRKFKGLPNKYIWLCLYPFFQIKRIAELLFKKRQRQGLNHSEALKMVRRRNYFGSMMVANGDADAMIGGMSRNYPDTVRPALQCIGRKDGVQKVSGMYILMTRFGPLFLADTTVNFNPTAEEIVEISELAAKQVEKFNIKPRIALLTYSNFGSAKGDDAEKMSAAAAILQQKHPDMVVDGEMQAHLPFDLELLRTNHPFSKLAEDGANTLIFPNLSASNIAYNLLKEVGEYEAIGPILLGMGKPVYVLQLGSSVREIVNMVTLAVVDAQNQS